MAYVSATDKNQVQYDVLTIKLDSTTNPKLKYKKSPLTNKGLDPSLFSGDNPRTNTLLRLENSFQVNGSDIDISHGTVTGWTIDASIITTNGSVASPSTYVVVLKPLIFG